jgi:hypothetical protein
MKLPLDLIPLPPQDSQARGRAYPRRSKSLLNDWCGMMPSGGDDQPIPNRGCLLHLGHSNMDPQSPSPPPDRALVEIKPIVHPSEINSLQAPAQGVSCQAGQQHVSSSAAVNWRRLIDRA